MEEQIDWEIMAGQNDSGKNHVAEQHLARSSQKAVKQRLSRLVEPVKFLINEFPKTFTSEVQPTLV